MVATSLAPFEGRVLKAPSASATFGKNANIATLMTVLGADLVDLVQNSFQLKWVQRHAERHF